MNRQFLPAVAAMLIATSVAAAPVRDAGFETFFTAFRKAVLSGDRRAVARMTHLPFTDYRAGRFCEPGDAGCTVAGDSATSAHEAAFLRNYDRIFTPTVVAAIRSGRVRAFAAGRDDGDVPSPIGNGEYLLDTRDADSRRVFARHGGRWMLERIPFQS